MQTRELLAYTGAITVSAVVFFLLGFCLAGSSNATGIGLALGVSSASAWASGSIGGPPRWNNSANVFAALFAVFSLGFLAPADQACQGAYGLIRQACALRSSFH